MSRGCDNQPGMLHSRAKRITKDVWYFENNLPRELEFYVRHRGETISFKVPFATLERSLERILLHPPTRWDRRMYRYQRQRAKEKGKAQR